MEDFILREIDRLGEMLTLIASRLGLLDGGTPGYTVRDVEAEFGNAGFPVDVDAILKHENPIWFLVEQMKASDYAVEIFVEILFNSDLEDSVKEAILNDALAYLDGKGHFSFRLHSLKM